MFAVINEYFSTGLSNGNCDVGSKPTQPYTTLHNLHNPTQAREIIKFFSWSN